MLRRLKTFVKKHKKWAYAWLAFECVGLAVGAPALANFVDTVRFEAKERIVVSHAEITPGQQRFLVASNAPFAIISEGVVAPMDISITTQGSLGGLNYGSNAQSPGENISCNIPSSTERSRIFTAQQRTAKSRGDAISQSVRIDISYDPALNPKIKFVGMDTIRGEMILLAMPCDLTLS